MLTPPPDPPAPTPPVVALLSTWAGLLSLVAAVVFVFLPGSRDPQAELEGVAPASLKDQFIAVPIYGSTVALFLGIVVLWRMRDHPRPLPDALLNQRVQAKVGVLLALLGTAVIYGYVAVYGPRSG